MKKFSGKRVLALLLAMAITLGSMPAGAAEAVGSALNPPSSSAAEGFFTPDEGADSGSDGASSSTEESAAPSEEQASSEASSSEAESAPSQSQEEVSPSLSAQQRIERSPSMQEEAAATEGGLANDNRTETPVTPFKTSSFAGASGEGVYYENGQSQLQLKNVVIFVRFAGQAEYLTSAAATSLNAVYNTTDGSFVSLKSYLETVSYGKVTVDTGFFPSVSGAYASVQISHEENYFKAYNASSNPVGYKTSAERASREKELIEEALQAVKAQVDAAYPSGELDVHGAAAGGADGLIDAVTFVCLPETSVQINFSDLLWPHKTSTSSAIQLGGKSISNYNLLWGNDLLRAQNYSSSTVTHEFLHILGMPDLYRYAESSSAGGPVWYYDVMANNASYQPQSLLQYNIRNVLGFAPALSVVKESTKSVALNFAAYTDSSEKTAVVLQSPYSANEVFVVEAKKQAGLDVGIPYLSTSAGTTGGGLLVYRVNKNVFGNASGPPDGIYALRPGETTLNGGQGTYSHAVLVPASVQNTTNRTALGKLRGKESTGFDNDALFYNDGSNSGIVISNLAYTTSGITFDVQFSPAKGTGTQADPYQISSAGDLSLMGQFPSSYFVLTNDIDMAGVAFTPIQGDGYGFVGQFDGQGHSLKNLTITAESAALFADIGIDMLGNKGVVQNLTLENPVITGTSAAAAVAVTQQGILKNVHVTGGTVSATAAAGRAGGLSAYLGDTGLVQNSSSSAAVSGYEAGGLAGCVFYGKIENSLAYGPVSGLGSTDRVGGLFGIRYVGDTSVTEQVFSGACYDALATGAATAGFLSGTSATAANGICAITRPTAVSVKVSESAANPASYAGTPGLAVSYASSDESIAKVNADGSAKGIKAGSASYLVSLTVGTKTISLTSPLTVAPIEPHWVMQDGKTYYMQADGSLATGTVEIEGKLYGFDANGLKTESGWYGWGSFYYWANSADNGALVRDGVALVADNRYAVFGLDGHQITDGFYTTTAGKTYYQVLATGYRVATGYCLTTTGTYYFSEEAASLGQLFVPDSAGWYTKGGKNYYFHDDGSVLMPPNIIDVTVGAGSSSGMSKITVYASFSGAAAAQSYSFDGGLTWQEANYTEIATGSAIATGKIQVRDAVGYIVVYDGIVNTNLGTVGFGIDVSSHQGPIDWQSMAANGVKYAIIRAVTWKGDSIVEDPYFRANVRAAKANGIYVGAYIYSYAFNYDEMNAEISVFHAAATALKAEGYTFDMPVFIDYEDPRLYQATGCPDYNGRTNIVRHGMDVLSQLGYYPGFYTYLNFFNTKMNGQQLMNEGYDFWLAHWDVPAPGLSGVEMWQYGTATINGVGYDGNYCYKDYTGLIHGSGGGSHVTTPRSVKVYDLNTKTVVEAPITTILAQMVANEVGSYVAAAASGGDAIRAYEVQAVAANSWLAYQYAHDSITPSVGLKDPASISLAVANNITTAVANVQNDYLFYDGAVALTTYYACSGGSTNNSADYWGTDLAYLRSVSCGSYEDALMARVPSVKKLHPVVWERTAAQLKADILKVQPAAVLPDGDLSSWIVPSDKNAAGYYTKVKLGGVDTNIASFYEGVSGPYSLNFTMQINGTGSITFTSYGWGHCVGMSQYAMIQMASGDPVVQRKDILAYFYPGTTYKTVAP